MLRIRITQAVVFIGICFSVFSVSAANISSLLLPGQFQPPGIVGTFPNTAEFSWIKHRSPDNTTYFSWNFGGGTDGGIIFDQSQVFTEMTDVFIMFNQRAGFFSVNNGLSIAADKTIDMSNLRMQQAGNIYDVGSGSGYDTLVPYVDDTLLLAEGQNGWSIGANGAFHLFYNTRGICDGCEMTVHLYGTTVVPVPAAIWLFISGIVGFSGFFRFKKQ